MAPSAQAGLKKQYLSSGSQPNKAPIEPRPSASILLISPTNQILLLHRVRRKTDAFAAAHVFPGGNLSSTQDGDIPSPTDPLRHTDSPAYRLGAIRECFEESGILLATKNDGSGALLEVNEEEREKARREIHAGRLRFEEWVAARGGRVDLDRLRPFTRWVTPTNVPKRFTTQMYIYFLPLRTGSVSKLGLPVTSEAVIPIPTSDGGLEHTAALFQSCSQWLEQARRNEIVLFPPQFYLMYLLSPFLKPPSSDSASLSTEELQRQRDEVMAFLQTDGGDGRGVLWKDKVMSPTALGGLSADGRAILALDKPGPELRDSGRSGDGDRVVLVRFGKMGPRDVEVKMRKDVLEEQRVGREKDTKL